MKQYLHNIVKDLFRIRDLRIVVPARSIAIAGDGLAMVALLLRTHDAGHGPAAVTALMVCFALPVVLLMGYAGHVADTHDSRHVLVTAGLAQVLACVGLATTHGLGTTLALVVVLQTGQAFANPVWSALVPRIVGEQDIGRVIALQQGISAATAPAGAALGGVLVGLYGAPVAFWCNAGTFAVLTLAAAAVRTRRHGASEAAGPTSRAGLTAGIRVIRRDRLVWPLFVALMPLVVVLEGVNVVEVFLVRDELGVSPTAYGLSEVAFGVGAVVGSVAVGRLSTDATRIRAVLLGLSAAATMVVVQGLAPHFWAYLVGGVALGSAISLSNGSLGALLMIRTADADRGKVGSAMNGVSRFFSISALLLGGVVGTLAGPRLTFMIGGAAGVVVMAVATVAVRRSSRRSDATTGMLPPWSSERSSADVA